MSDCFSRAAQKIVATKFAAIIWIAEQNLQVEFRSIARFRNSCGRLQCLANITFRLKLSIRKNGILFFVNENLQSSLSPNQSLSLAESWGGTSFPLRFAALIYSNITLYITLIF